MTTSWRKASGLYWACFDAATLISASCSLVVPNSCMCRCAARAYPLAGPHIPHDDSKLDSGASSLRAPACTPPVRGLPAKVISATRHLPAAIADAACPTWHTYEEPPVSVLSTYEQRNPM